MKSHISRITAFLAAAATLAGCATIQEQDLSPATQVRESRTISFLAKGTDTKTTFGEKNDDGVYSTFWNENDKAVISLNMATGVESGEITLSDNARSAAFSAEIQTSQAEAPYTFYAISPSAAVLGISKSHGGWKLHIPSDQTPLDGSPDEGSQIIVASESVSSIPDEVKLNFSHLTSYGKLSLTNLSIDGDDAVESVVLDLEEPWAGEFFYNYEDATLEENGSSKSITLSTSKTSDLWFSCAPVDVSGKKLTVTVVTGKGSYTKTVTFPSGRKFASGRVASFSVNFSGVAIKDHERTPDKKIYRLVKDASALEAGKEILIVSSDGLYAAGSGQTNYRTAVDIIVENETIDSETLDPSVDIYTLETGTVSGTWAFALGGSSYLSGQTSSNNLPTTTRKGGNTNWIVSITSDGIATVGCNYAYTTGSYRHIRYNKSAARFSGYKSSSSTVWNSTTNGTSPISLYMEDVLPGEAVSHPVLDENAYGAYLTIGNYIYSEGSDHLSREYGSSTVDFAIISSPEDQVSSEFQGIPLTLEKGDTFNLRYLRKNGQATEIDKSMMVTVLKIDGPKVWLESADGNSFIVKK